MSWHEVGETSYYAHTDSFGSGAQHRVYGGTLGGGSSDLSGAAFGHIWVGENTLPFVTDTFSLVSDGYRGELASDRIARLGVYDAMTKHHVGGIRPAAGHRPEEAQHQDRDGGALWHAGR